ncbi:ATP-dependent DNA ligase [Herbiconiux sp. P18]|uniref:ATP-dependent DNA ligase n=1 Tax=Herbiconiux liangxiaofengii TaxID=3342795 RepID=UPI0035B7E090
MASTSNEQTVTVGGHRLRITNLEKVLYPETGTTKADVFRYYAEIAPVLLPHSRDRPATRKRWVHGVGTDGHPGQVFFQKNLDEGTPDWVRRVDVQHSDHVNVYPLVNDAATLAWLAQIAALEIHVPQWRVDARGRRQNPDRFVIDLDPGEGAGLPECVEVAALARSILTGMGLEPVPVTSGSKGIHLYAPLDGSQSSEQVSAVAHELARALEADHPDLVVSDMKKTLRTGKVLVDWSQNNGNKTTICPYSLRGRSRPTVAVPRTWEELESPGLRQLELGEVLERMREREDPLTESGSGSSHDDDRLAVYRSKRDQAKTPEPVPSSAPTSTDGRSFVIQEHHARRLHWDFRLEHDGVLVSWALPKGVPDDPGQNHLAVMTEDHPLEYGSFEGSIPAGEYGAGNVTIWDSGTYDLEKWRDGREVIVTLHGQPSGGLGDARKVALIHTGRGGDDAKNWLMHRMIPKTRDYTPMFAALASPTDLDDESQFAFEMKWDGIRAIARVDRGAVTLHTRNGNDVSAAYPELTEALARLYPERSLVLDGEVVALEKSGRPSFGRLQQRMGLSKPREVEAARAAVKVDLLVFDILELDGSSLVSEPYDERRRILSRVAPADDGPVHVPPAFDGDLEHAMTVSRELGLEGVMAKRRDSTYTTARSRAWLKLKHHLAQEVVIGGWRPGKGRRASQVGSLLMGVPDGDGRLQYVGRVGTGFSERDLEQITSRLTRLERKTSPFDDVPRADASDAVWVTPSLVGEVSFAEWTATGRLRQPSWRGWRPDKSPADVIRE